jgi:hypothetical protein
MNQFYERTHLTYSITKHEYNYSVQLLQFYRYPTIHSATRARPSTKLTTFTSLPLSIMLLHSGQKSFPPKNVHMFLHENRMRVYVKFSMQLWDTYNWNEKTL